MPKAPIHFQTISEQAKLIRKRLVSPVALVEAYLERIEALDVHLRAFNTVLGEMALLSAKAAEREVAAGKYRGALHGIPIAVKDQMNITGVPNTSGSRVYLSNVATSDATVIRRLRRAGAILLGTLSTHEFHIGPTQHFLRGTPRNPWDLKRTPGGSSSGAGSAVAAGMCSAAIGGDTGGSIRGPAAYCGVSGMRPTWSRVSRHGVFPLAWSMDAIGPLARSADDCAVILQAIGGRDGQDRTTTRQRATAFDSELTRDIGNLTIGLVDEMMDEMPDREVRSAISDSAETLRRAGARVENVSIPILRQPILFLHAATVEAEAASYHWPALKERYFDLDRNTRVRLVAAAALPSVFHVYANRLRAAIAADLIAAFRKFDILIGPHRGPAPLIKARPRVRSHRAATNDLLGLGTGIATAFSMAGVPCAAIPCGLSHDGLPLSLHLAGGPMRDSTLLRVCHAFQAVTDWHLLRPDVGHLQADDSANNLPSAARARA